MTSPTTHESNVRSTVVGVAHHIDFKRWHELERCFMARVSTDYTSLFGGAPVEQAVDELVAGWRSALEGIVTQHLLGPIDVQLEGPSATAECHVRAQHYAPGAPGGEHWEVLGQYRFELVSAAPGWLIRRMALVTLMQLGNLQLLAEARRSR